MKRPRHNHSPTVDTKAALVTLKDEKTIAQFAARYNVHANQMMSSKTQPMRAPQGFFAPAHPGPRE